MRDKRPSALGLALTFLRSKRRWSKKQLARALKMGDRSLLSRYERGDGLSREKIGTLIHPLGYSLEAVDVLVFADRLLSSEDDPQETASPLAPTSEESKRINRAAVAAGLRAAEVIYSELIRRKRSEKLNAEHQEARALWARLRSASGQQRRELVASFPEFRSWALAKEVSHTSERAASNSARDALELAGLALSIADRVPGESLRARVQGYCWAYVANARRVANDLEGADEAFTRAWDLWRAGAASDPELFPEWRVLDLEASLRRAERRFPQALALLHQARAASGEEPMAVGRILLKKEHVFDQMGDTEAAFAALTEAAPFVEASGDPRQLLSLRFKTANNLCHLKRHEEAARMLLQVRELAVEQGNELDLIRVVWLDARIAVAQGRTEDAVAGLEQVRRDFAGHELPYDAALASLDLAVLWLEAGRTDEVRELAVEMQAIFKAKKIDREALYALSLFCEAARQETATVELAQRVRAEIEKARGSASLKKSERPR